MAAASSPTGSASPALSTHGSARSNRSDEPSSGGAGPASGSSTTFEQLGLLPPNESMSSPAGSPARASALSASATASITPRPGSGERWPEPLASFDPSTSSSRTWRTCSPSMMEPSGPRFSETWPRSGMTCSGIAYRRQPLAPRTSVTGSSPLLPTPTARAKGGSPVWKGSRQGGLILDEAISRLLPTPTATDYGNNQSPSDGAAVRESLPRLLKLLPTPRARTDKEHVPDGMHWGELRPVVESLSTGASTEPPSADGKPSKGLDLSPWFVEWMMGAPVGWSDPDVPLSATEFKSSSARWSGTTS